MGWQGVSKRSKREGLKLAQDFISKNNRPAWTQVTSIIEKGEPAEFKVYFYQWNPPRLPTDFKQESNVAKTPEQKEIDVARLLIKSKTDELPVDDGSGKVKCGALKISKKSRLRKKNSVSSFLGIHT